MSFERVVHVFTRAFRRPVFLYWLVSRGMTLGVRAVVLDEAGRVFLVRHSYVPGWSLPGGGVEPGETCLDALTRELMEEGRIALSGPAALHGVYINRRLSRRDHVLLYVVRQFSQDRPPSPNAEIVDSGFFDPAALPADTTAATRQRIAEILDGRAAPAGWS